MNEEQEQNLTAWLQALHEENKRLNKQVKHLSDVIEVMGLHSAKMQKDAESTRFRVGALCLFMIVIPLLMALFMCTVGVGAAAGTVVKEAKAAEVRK